MHSKIAILKQLQTHFKAKREKVWERRSHAFPPRYISAWGVVAIL